MREIEKRCLLEIEAVVQSRSYVEYFYTYDMAKMCIAEYCQGSFGKSTMAFLSSPVLRKYLEDTEEKNLWMLIENYICSKVEPTQSYLDLIKKSYLDLIELEIKKIRAEVFKPSGQGLFTHISSELIRNIYLSNNSVLIALFMSNLPVPPVEIFEGYHVPKILLDKKQQAQASVAKFSQRAQLGLEDTVVQLQRYIRSKNRKKEERHRIARYHLDSNFSVDHILKNVSIPYIPKSVHCSPSLRVKIMQASEKINLFTTVRHVTAESYIDKIFDEGLMGRRTLLQKYLPFKPAALDACDLEYGGGDANVICFGPNEIDPKADPKLDFIEIVMNLDKIKPNPCVFYKQKDLGFYRECASQIKIKNQFFYFTHIRELKGRSNVGTTNLQFSKEFDGDKDEDFIAYSILPNYLFSGYNQNKIHQILVLNFFRYVDTLFNFTTHQPDDSVAQQLYEALDQLSEVELLLCLQDIGRQMTITAEFNFYGMYKIDFSAVKSIENEFFYLELVEFIKALEAGDIDELERAQTIMPKIFKSYRFIDYLLSVPESKNYPEFIKKDLQFARSLCCQSTCLTPAYNAQRGQEQEEVKMPPPCKLK